MYYNAHDSSINRRRFMPKKHYSRSSQLKTLPIIKTTGLLMVIGMWEYGNKAINYVSHKIKNIIHTNKLDNLADWFSVETITAVTLGSQIFIKACGNHSPAVNYVEKSIIGLEYYTLTAGSSAVARSILDSFVNWDANVKGWTSTAVGIGMGAVAGTFTQAFTEKPLDKTMGYIDYGSGMVIGALAGASSSIIGSYDHQD